MRTWARRRFRWRRESGDEDADDSLGRPEYKRAVTVVTVVWIGLFLLFSAIEFPFGGFIVLIFLIGFPLIAWAAIAHLAAVRFFRYFIIRRQHFVLLRRLRITSPTNSDYFLVNTNFPESITWRFVQTVSVVFLVASIAVSELPSSIPRTPFAETIPFFASGFVALCLVMPFVFLLWTFEDSGLRRQDRNNDTVGRVGTLFEQSSFGSGAATTFLRFVMTLNGPMSQIVAWAFAMFVLLLP